MHFAEMIKKARASLGLSYRKLSEETGISHSHIRDIENGKYTPSFDNAIKLASALDINIKDVVVSTYQLQLQNLLFELIEICDQQEIAIPYKEWINSNLPIQPIGIDRTKLHDLAFRIAEPFYTESNEQVLNKKLELLDYISYSKCHSFVYDDAPELLETLNKTALIQGIPYVKNRTSALIKTLKKENESILYDRGDIDE